MGHEIVGIKRNELHFIGSVLRSSLPKYGHPLSTSHKTEVERALADVERALAVHAEDFRTGDEALFALPEPDEASAPEDRKFTAEDMRDYALQAVDNRIVAWHLHRPAVSSCVMGVYWPQVDRIISDKDSAKIALNSITADCPGTLTPMTSGGIIALLRSTLMENQGLWHRKDNQAAGEDVLQMKESLAAILVEREKAISERDLALAGLRAITRIEDEMFGGDWEEIERARGVAHETLIGCGASVSVGDPGIEVDGTDQE